MTEELKFFSPEWCEAAVPLVNSHEATIKGFKDAATFTHRMAFTCAERGLVTHMEWKEGKVSSWSGPQYDESDLWLVIDAGLATWQAAASGASEGGKFLLAGKIKFKKGPMSAAIENAGAFNNFLLSWGKVPTDWDV